MSNKVLAVLTVAAVGLGIGLTIGMTNKTQSNSPTNNSEYARTSVKITLTSGRSGGSGVILKSSNSTSQVLTNLHICDLIQNGGVVTYGDNSYPVATYKVYPKSDLCLITVQTNLGVNTNVASSAPDLYSPITVVGHPALLPTAITTGHFSGRMVIQLMVDLESCDGTETNETAMMCMFMGGKPVLRSFDSQFTTALIMPGSSGSGVFNERGELSGLVFAGQGDLGFGFIVPFEYVRDFLLNQDQYPNHIPDAKAKPVNYLKGSAELASVCRNGNFRTFCKQIKFQEVFINGLN